MGKEPEKYILDIIEKYYPGKSLEIYNKSNLIQYFNLKSNAIHGNTKTRRSYANWYAIYSLLHFYKEKGFINNPKYNQFKGFKFTELFNFTRTLYGGDKLQNHALNNRVNGEFINHFGSEHGGLILIDDKRYRINPYYLYIDGEDLTEMFIEIVEGYINLLIEKDKELLYLLEDLKKLENPQLKKESLLKLINEDTEARIFEIFSYAILSNYYKQIKLFIGNSKDDLKEEYLQLYKTGRTNANDGGIDFVMKPGGRFFQVTEVGNYDKYFLDIDKVLGYPITFVVKTNSSKNIILKDLVDYAIEKSDGQEIIKNRYIDAIEEVITINELKKYLNILNDVEINQIISDIELYYKLEFNIP